MRQDPIQYFADLIQRELGIVYSDFNQFQLQNRLEEIARMSGATDLGHLQKIALEKMTPELKQLILDIATNNETSFFRDPKLFQAFDEALLGPLLRNKDSEVRIWSAACSNGQEPYSLAMLAKEHHLKNSRSADLRITATDVSTRVIEKAERGRFSQLEVQRGVPSSLLEKYFKKDEDGHWTVVTDIRSTVEFKRLNLLDSFSSLEKFDVIFCRNVLIYQNVENKVRIIKRLAERLNSGGYLVLGAGESLIGLSEEFDVAKFNDVIFYHLKSDRRLRN